MAQSAQQVSHEAEATRLTETVMLYDIMCETETSLSARYVKLSEEAPTAADRAKAWQRVLDLYAEAGAVDSRDRASILEHIERWRAELATAG